MKISENIKIMVIDFNAVFRDIYVSNCENINCAEDFMDIYSNSYKAYLENEYHPAYNTYKKRLSDIIERSMSDKTADQTQTDTEADLFSESILQTEAYFSDTNFSGIPYLHRMMLHNAKSGDYYSAINYCYHLIGALSDLIAMYNELTEKTKF